MQNISNLQIFYPEKLIKTSLLSLSKFLLTLGLILSQREMSFCTGLYSMF